MAGATSAAASGRGAASVALYVPGAHAGKLHDRAVGYFAYVFSGMLRKSEEAGLALHLTPYPAGQLAALLAPQRLAQLGRTGVQGLLFLFTDRAEDRLLARGTVSCPWLAVNRRLRGAELIVRTDERRGGREAAGHLLARGHARIGVLAGPARFEFFEERLAGAREALAEAGRALPPAYVARAELSVAGGREAARRLLDLAQPPTALFATEEDFAAGALAEAEARGLRVPEDLSLVAASDFILSARRGRAVTAIGTPAFELGYLAVELLLLRARLAVPMRAEVVLQPTLVVRDSVATPRA